MTKKILALCLATLALQGCFGAFLAGAAIGGAVVYKGRNYEQEYNDVTIALKAQEKINQDYELKHNTRIVISSYNGVVLLTGQAPAQSMRLRAIQLVKTVPNIKRVYDEITIANPISATVQSNDAWITTKVKSQLLATKGLDSSQIKVVTEDGVVFLIGVTTPMQTKIAADVARKVTNVRKVVTLFEFQP
jgi:osmotically-inducible protein OsmY